jgi:hypothetical protein
VALMQRRGARSRLAIAGMLAGIAGLAGMTGGCGKEPERVDPNIEIFGDFSKRIDDYVALRNKLADSVGPLDPKMSQNDIAARSTKLANAIVAARQGAKPGDIFTPEAAAILASLIKQEYDRRPPRILEARGDAQEELKEERPDFDPQVNQIYPTGAPLATFPASLLPLLPQLPKEIEYRIVRSWLLIRDIEANVVVDIMPHAVPQEKLP